MAKSMTNEEFAERIRNSRDGKFELASEFNEKPFTVRDKIMLRHSCGNEFTTTYQSFVNDNRGDCRACRPLTITKKEKLTLDVMKERILEKFNGDLEYVDGFINGKEKCLFRHVSCGNTYLSSPKELLRATGRDGCPFCKSKRIINGLSNHNLLEELLVKCTNGDEFTWEENYKLNNKIPHTIRHSCGLIFKSTPNYIQQKGIILCPICHDTSSTNEQKVLSYLKSLNIKFEKEYTSDEFINPMTNRKFRFDFMIPLSSKKLLIEIDGEFHDPLEYCDDEYVILQKTKTRMRDEIKNFLVEKLSDKYILVRIHHSENISARIVEVIDTYVLSPFISNE